MNTQLIKMLISLKNASGANKTNLVVKNNPLLIDCLSVLYRDGLILSYVKDRTKLVITLRYFEGVCLTSNLTLMSKVSHLKFLTYRDICRINSGNKIGYLLTTKGVKTLNDCKISRMGGLLIFYV